MDGVNIVINTVSASIKLHLICEAAKFTCVTVVAAEEILILQTKAMSI